MVAFLQREQAPLTGGQWTALDQTVIQTAQSALVGRRFLSLVGPFGSGVEAVPTDTLRDSTRGQIDLLGTVEDQAIDIEHRRYMPMPLIYKDFWIHWRDLESNRQFSLPLDMSKAAAAALSCAHVEDQLIFEGDESLGIPGVRRVEGREARALRDWSQEGEAFADVVEGVRILIGRGFTGPYALAVSTQLYAHLHRVFDNTGVLEIEQVEKLARRGVYPSSVLPERSALLVDSGPDNMDLAVAVDLSTAFVESANLNYHFRVLESVVPRIHRPGAICTFDAPAG